MPHSPVSSAINFLTSSLYYICIKAFILFKGNGPNWRFISWKESGPLQNRHRELKY